MPDVGRKAAHTTQDRTRGQQQNNNNNNLYMLKPLRGQMTRDQWANIINNPDPMMDSTRKKKSTVLPPGNVAACKIHSNDFTPANPT